MGPLLPASNSNGNMKTFITISAAIILSFAALSWAQIIHPYECHCGVFMSLSSGEREIYHMKSAHVDGCGTENSTAACMNVCEEEWKGMYKKGDLNAELPSGYNLGQNLSWSSGTLPSLH